MAPVSRIALSTYTASLEPLYTPFTPAGTGRRRRRRTCTCCPWRSSRGVQLPSKAWTCRAPGRRTAPTPRCTACTGSSCLRSTHTPPGTWQERRRTPGECQHAAAGMPGARRHAPRPGSSTGRSRRSQPTRRLCRRIGRTEGGNEWPCQSTDPRRRGNIMEPTHLGRAAVAAALGHRHALAELRADDHTGVVRAAEGAPLPRLHAAVRRAGPAALTPRRRRLACIHGTVGRRRARHGRLLLRRLRGSRRRGCRCVLVRRRGGRILVSRRGSSSLAALRGGNVLVCRRRGGALVSRGACSGRRS